MRSRVQHRGSKGGVLLLFGLGAAFGLPTLSWPDDDSTLRWNEPQSPDLACVRPDATAAARAA
jgi:hypothetical protein